MTSFQWISLAILLVSQLVGITTVIIKTSFTTRQIIDDRFSSVNLKINTIIEGDIRELRGKISQLESGQSEWLKTLRERTHDLAGECTVLTLKVDRLERQHKEMS